MEIIKKMSLALAILAVGHMQLQADSTYKLTETEERFINAAKEGKTGIIKSMLRQRMMDQRLGYDVLDINVWSSLDKEGLTALMLASRFEHPVIVKLLLDAGAKVNEKNLHDATALHLAGNNADIVTMLIKKGADKNAKDDYGDTPLIYAAQFNFMKKAKALIQAGANPTLTNKKGLTAEAIARQHYPDDTKLADYLAKEATAWK